MNLFSRFFKKKTKGKNQKAPDLQMVKVPSEAQERKERSIRQLQNVNVPFIDHLPVIESEAESTRRTTKEVANRAVALCMVALKAEGLEQNLVDQLIEEFQIASSFTPAEDQFIKNSDPSHQHRVQFSWQYECFWVMLWALGFVDKLDYPDHVCDTRQAVSILRNNGADGFLENAQLRPQIEILDEADLILRYHWATFEARIKGRKAPAGLDTGVVMERHYALNWLIGYMDQDWDDISTDT